MYNQIYHQSFNFLPILSSLQPSSYFNFNDTSLTNYLQNFGSKYKIISQQIDSFNTPKENLIAPISANYKFLGTSDYLLNYFNNKWISTKIAINLDSKMLDKKKLVVVGTGWGSTHFIKNIDVSKYDVTVVSPRNFFIFTPILPLSVGGAISFETCLEPIHRFLNRGGKQVMKFHEATVEQVNIENKSLTCYSYDGTPMDISYDYLVLGIGTDVNTFNIPGVEKHCYFFKELQHSRNLQEKLFANFEKASLPATTDEEKAKLLHVVVVGAGPTGVETSAEIWDLMTEEGKKYYPKLAPFMKLTIIEMLPNILPSYLPEFQEYAKTHLTSSGINIKCNTAVSSITDDMITLKTKTETGSNESEESYGIAIWASGVTQTKLGKKIQMSIPQQTANKFLTTDSKLKVLGTDSIYAMGDCCMISPPKLVDIAGTLYTEAKNTPDGAGTTFIAQKVKNNQLTNYPQTHSSIYNFDTQPKSDNMNYEAFVTYLKDIDKAYKSPPPTAQNASQAATYLALMFNKYVANETTDKSPAYVYKSLGSLAYLGKGKAVLDFKVFQVTGGFYSGFLWKAAYCSMLLSPKAKLKFVEDLFNSKFFGRYTTLEHKSSTNT